MAQLKTTIVNSNDFWSAIKRYKVGETTSFSGMTYQNITGKNSSPDLSNDWISLGVNELASASVFKFIQKGFGNITQEIYEEGDIFCGWRNDGLVRYAEAKWLGGPLNNSDNFEPLVAAEPLI